MNNFFNTDIAKYRADTSKLVPGSMKTRKCKGPCCNGKLRSITQFAEGDELCIRCRNREPRVG
jgi:hypothetical protein